MLKHTNNFFIIFKFVWSIVQLMQVESTCTKVVGRCDREECNSHCKSYATNYEGGIPLISANCSSVNNLCTCHFDHGITSDPSSPNCNIDLGICGEMCDDSCCNAKCSRSYTDGVGTCIDFFGVTVCMCGYKG